jgi:O-antigen ligase
MNNSVFEHCARWCILGVLMGLALSTAVANIALVFFLLFALLSNKWKDYFSLLARDPLSQYAVGIFTILLLSVGWSDAGSGIALQWVSKYKKLLLIPLAMPFFQTNEHKRLFINGIYLSLMIALLISYYQYFVGGRERGCIDLGCLIHGHITLSMQICLLFILSIGSALSSRNLIGSIVFYSIAVMSALNVALVLQSRTGQLMLIALLVFLPFILIERHAAGMQRKRLLALMFSVLVVGLLTAGIFHKKESRLVESIQKITEQKVDSFKSTDTAVSVDVRFEFYRKTLTLIADKPLLGWGAGGQELELKRLSEQGVTDYERIVFANPHNEYLTWAVQTGLLGLACFLFWLFTVWRHAFKIEDPAHKLIMLGWLLIFTLGNFLNSFLLDFSEGYMTVLLIAVLMPFQSQRPCSTEEK